MIEETHKRNFELIKKHSFKVGDVLKLNKKGKEKTLNSLNYVTIKNINSFYGWILFNENEQLPQEAEELLKFIKIKGGLKK